MRSRVLAALGAAVLVGFGGCAGDGGAADGTAADAADSIPAGEGLRFAETAQEVYPDLSFDPGGSQDWGSAEAHGTGGGQFLEKCSQDGDCASGWCVEHLGEGVCSQSCEDKCPAGWECTMPAGPGPEPAFVCLSAHANLCRPCLSSEDCTSSDGQSDACVDYGEEGAFCGGQCKVDSDCPWGFSCQTATTTEGAPLPQCLPAAGICPCSEKSSQLRLATECSVTNESGTCKGSRSCGPEGLSACDAPTPSPEVCDGLDNDCNGPADNPVLRDGMPVDLCDDGNPCTKDSCLGADGCSNQPLDATGCQDGDPCTEADHCETGECVGKPLDCDDDNPCTEDLCTAEAGECAHPPLAGPCDDDDPCTVDDECAQGKCVAGKAANCDDGNPCTDDACDPENGCVHAGNENPCDDGNPCTFVDQCSGGKCTAGAPVDCDDGNPCTNDVCNKTTGCFHQFKTGPCDDGNKCTLGDACSQGKCIYSKLLECNDENPCTDDSCDPSVGCVLEINDSLCSDGNACTVDDHCDKGVCQPGKPLTCSKPVPCIAAACDPKAGCQLTPFSVAPPAVGSNSPVCEEGELKLTADGASGVAYAWTGPDGFTSKEQNPVLPAVTTQEAGIYTVVASLDGCESQPAAVVVAVTPTVHGAKQFSYTGGAQAWTVPECITQLTVDAFGAEGGDSKTGTSQGGKGGRVQAVLPVTPGKPLHFFIGGTPVLQTGGYNGGGQGSGVWIQYSGGGGGASDIRGGGAEMTHRILVAGGGGGAGRTGNQAGLDGG
jgi:hypothetical protein